MTITTRISNFLLIVDFFEDVFEAAIILLQDGVLGTQVQRPAFAQSNLEGAVGKVPDRLVRIIHPHGYTTSTFIDTETNICK